MFLVVPAVSAALTVALAVPASIAMPAPVVQPRLLSTEFFGMHAISTPPSRIPGVASIRLWDTDTTWRVLNPKRGVFHWRTLDDRVAAAERSGTSVLLVLGATPEWAARSLDAADAPWLGSGSASPPKRMRDWSAFVTAVVKRYAGRIEAYQVWNEPADRIFWRGSDATLARMTRDVYDTVRSIDPDAMVVAAPFVVRKKHWQADASTYLAALAGQRWPVDVLAFHGYASGAPSPAAHRNAIAQVGQFLAASSAPPLPLWETEVNYPEQSAQSAPVGASTERSWLARTYLDAVRMGVDRVYWYAYAAVPDFLAVDIRSPAVSPAFAAVSAWMTDAYFVGCTDDWQSLVDVTGCAFVDREGRPSVALWSPIVQGVHPGRGRVTDLEGVSWPVTSSLLVSTAPVWFTPSDQPS